MAPELLFLLLSGSAIALFTAIASGGDASGDDIPDDGEEDDSVDALPLSQVTINADGDTEIRFSPMGPLRDDGPAPEPGTDYTLAGTEGRDLVFLNDGWRPEVDDVSVAVAAGDGDDRIWLDTEADVTVDAGSGNDFVWDDIAVSGQHTVLGGAGDDSLTGTRGELEGGEGDDDLVALSTARNLVMTGGAGSDRFVINGGGAFDASATITDFDPARDTLSANMIAGSRDPLMLADMTSRLSENGQDSILTLTYTDPTGAQGDVEYVVTVQGVTDADALLGMVRVGGEATERFDGDDGDQSVTVDGPAWLDLGAGNDSVEADRTDGSIVANLGDGDDEIAISGTPPAGSGDPYDYGPFDMIDTGAGNDLVELGAGHTDTQSFVNTGAGNDTVEAATAGEIHTGGGNDVINLEDAPIYTNDIEHPYYQPEVRADAGAGADQVTMRQTHSVDLGDDSDADVANILMDAAPETATKNTSLFNIGDEDLVSVHYDAPQPELEISVSGGDDIWIRSDAGTVVLHYSGDLALTNADGSVNQANLDQIVGVNNPAATINLIVPVA